MLKIQPFFGGGGKRDGEDAVKQGTGKMVVVVGVGGTVSRESEAVMMVVVASDGSGSDGHW
jgi:hypothetical protein